MNDWRVHAYNMADAAINMLWGAPQFSNRPKDIRGRQAAPSWRPDISVGNMNRLKLLGVCVYRALYDCSGSCRKLPSLAQLRAHGELRPGNETGEWQGESASGRLLLFY